MKWNPTWDLTTIPDELLKREWARRNSLRRRVRRGGRAPSCLCGECETCRRREKMRRYRERRR
jgi:hypothetical protein